jgi:hypothetical protein
MDLLQTDLGEIITFLGKRNQELIQVDSSMEVEEVGKLMKQKGILSVPVFDSTKRQFIGQVKYLTKGYHLTKRSIFWRL